MSFGPLVWTGWFAHVIHGGNPMYQEKVSDTTAAKSGFARTDSPVFVELPPQPQAAQEHPAPAVGAQWSSPLADLIADLRSWSADTACGAAIAMGKPGERAAVAPLIEVVEDHGNYFHSVVRAAACASLGQLGDWSATPALLNAINDPTAEVSAEAVRALGVLGDERAIEPLMEVMRNQDGFFLPGVCLAAAAALQEFKSPREAEVPQTVAADIDENTVFRDAMVTPVHLADIKHESIAEAAYAIWQNRGWPDGEALQNWLQAEAELRAKRSAFQQPA